MCARVTALVLGFWLLASLAFPFHSGRAQQFQRIPLQVPPNGKPGFTLLSPETTGIAFSNTIPEERFRTNQMLLNGSGVAAGDVDGDGLCDLYFCAITGSNVLYKNLGNWKFKDITAQAGVGMPNTHSSGCALVDLDGDGDLDLVVSTLGHGLHIFINDGKGHFQEIMADTPMNPRRGGTSLAFGDLHGDGWLDIYAANYRSSALMDMPNTRFFYKLINGKQTVTTVNGRPVSDPEYADRYVVTPRGSIEELGEPDAIFRNVGGKSFAPLSFTNGNFLDENGVPLAAPPFDWGLSVMIRDINQDGLPDIYVCNDFNAPDRVWLNQGHGKFREAPHLTMRKSAMFSMGVDFGDLNRDGWDDFMVVDMLSRDRVLRLTTSADNRPPVTAIGQFDNRPQYMMNALFMNRGDGTYAETALFSGLAASDWSWSVIFLDVDLDGWEDVLVCTGNERAARDMDVAEKLRALRTQKQLSPAEILESRKLFPRLALPKVAFRNQHNLTFQEMGKDWGFDTVGVSQGMALADLDNDGDMDVVINNLNGAAGIYRNNTSAPRLAVRLKGLPPNANGIGARIEVSGGPVAQSQEMIAGGRYLSSDQPMRVFAAGSVSNRLRIEVTWPNGGRTVVPEAQPNSIYVISEDRNALPTRAMEDSTVGKKPVRDTTARPLFEDVSSRLNHRHAEEPFDDFARQPLLPNNLSQMGPGITWCDLNGDGLDDLVIGSGRGGSLALFQNDGKGGFQKLEDAALSTIITRDQTTVLAWQKSPGQSVMLTAMGNYEDGMAAGACVRQYDLLGKTVADAIPAPDSTAGPMALADLDGDGNLELFVGGRVLPGRYPEPASSMICRFEAGSWKVDADNTKALANIGLVSGAVFSDIDGDGAPDLILACEWGPLRIFRNVRGKLRDVTASLGMDKFKGWWTSVAAGDFDGDGRMDLVAGNWGQNTRYEAHRAKPLRIYYGNIPGAEPGTLIESYYEPAMQHYVPERGLDFMARGLPWLKQKFTTYDAYARANLEEIFGPDFPKAAYLEANWLETTVFLNRGDHFEAKVLPGEAQLAPAFGVCVGDLDGDGFEDIFLAQNFFASQPETPRYDAGLGLILKGDGKGNFAALSSKLSGIQIYGEQRGAALADFDRDGRLDLAVGQNGGETKLYHNLQAPPGLRVRLVGPSGNTGAVGSRLRLLSGGQPGPMHEIHAGSGYLSQDSPVQILGKPSNNASLAISWPGGKETKVNVPAGAREIVVDIQGKLQTIR
ncbi:MAG: ASPIC/UnbV domain protein [Verrucomicrobiales bacterium]|nr:ASPIC/UnbV domain protein [Verrucomicrobiales bacterium]